MRNKNTLIIGMIISLILFSPFLVSVQSWTFTPTVTQNPQANNVEAGDEVNITATIGTLLGKITTARLGHEVNGRDYSTTYCNEPLPTSDNVITWTIGPFSEGDEVMYEITLRYDYVGVSDYYGERNYFTILIEEEEESNGDGFLPKTTTNIIWIALGIATAVIVGALLIKNKRG